MWTLTSTHMWNPCVSLNSTIFPRATPTNTAATVMAMEELHLHLQVQAPHKGMRKELTEIWSVLYSDIKNLHWRDFR